MFQLQNHKLILADIKGRGAGEKLGMSAPTGKLPDIEGKFAGGFSQFFIIHHPGEVCVRDIRET